eukprot:scaffold25657_cov16-Tisochrysis_lutea.AAC.1
MFLVLMPVLMQNRNVSQGPKEKVSKPFSYIDLCFKNRRADNHLYIHCQSERLRMLMVHGRAYLRQHGFEFTANSPQPWQYHQEPFFCVKANRPGHSDCFLLVPLPGEAFFPAHPQVDASKIPRKQATQKKKGGKEEAGEEVEEVRNDCWHCLINMEALCAWPAFIIPSCDFYSTMMDLLVFLFSGQVGYAISMQYPTNQQELHMSYMSGMLDYAQQQKMHMSCMSGMLHPTTMEKIVKEAILSLCKAFLGADISRPKGLVGQPPWYKKLLPGGSAPKQKQPGASLGAEKGADRSDQEAGNKAGSRSLDAAGLPAQEHQKKQQHHQLQHQQKGLDLQHLRVTQQQRHLQQQRLNAEEQAQQLAYQNE